MDIMLQGTRTITDDRIAAYRAILVREEKRNHTIDKYIRDIRKLKEYLAGRDLTKELLIRYKEHLESCARYTATSINSFLAAANSFCNKMGWEELRIKMIKIQRRTFETEDRELTQNEYNKLVQTAFIQGNERIALVIQTLGSTGIRISELQFVTVESLNKGMSDVYNKGKVRRIMYPKELVKALKAYAKKKKITDGCIFRTRTGKPLDRSNVWREMKKLCNCTNISVTKVFPHNLRHLFARNFYKIKKDIALLSDILGHSDVTTTRIYIRSTGKEHRKQLDMMHMVICRADSDAKESENKKMSSQRCEDCIKRRRRKGTKIA